MHPYPVPSQVWKRSMLAVHVRCRGKGSPFAPSCFDTSWIIRKVRGVSAFLSMFLPGLAFGASEAMMD